MASYYSSITDEQAELIKNTPLFFVGTSAPTESDISEGVGQVNISPKGGFIATTCIIQTASLIWIMQVVAMKPPVTQQAEARSQL